jgi:deoxyribodipyrimidine photo-lyase
MNPQAAAKPYESALFWFRRDLRLEDNAGLHHALVASRRVHCAFVFDREILDELPARRDRRVEFIWECVRELREALREHGAALTVLHGIAREAIPRLAADLGVQAVFACEDYEPQARARDDAVAAALGASGRTLHRAKDQVVFGRDELLTRSGAPYVVFTPYKHAWLERVDDFHLKAYPVERHLGALAKSPPAPLPSLGDLGFERTNLAALAIPTGAAGAHRLLEDFLARIGHYHEARDFPAVKGVSYLSVHNRFGTVSIRRLAREARSRRGPGAQAWLSELVWRDFYFQVIWHHPHAATGAFRTAYDAIRWPGDDRLFAAWCEGRTGYPLVDAAMHQINQTGYMHNRLRMVVASFLTKDLGIDWRRGEAYFALHLNDFDLAANNGGWQWAASTGCDAQPWFRIFNPVAQSQRFDPGGRFIRRYLPALAKVPDAFIHSPWTMPPLEQEAAGCRIGRDYPAPIVDHAMSRARALELYRAVRGEGPAAP